MLGRFDYSALPFYSPIAFSGAAVTVLAGVGVIAVITYFRAWGWLWRDWLTTVDHKKLGIMYIVVALVMLLRGFADGIMMRFQQLASVNSTGYLDGDHFAQVFSAHGTIMIFFMATTFMTGLINFAMPLQIGARDVSFPFLNALSFWLTVAGAGLVLISLVFGKFSIGGWTGYPPLTGVERNPGVGVDYWIWAVFISGFGTTLSGVNFIVTILKRRAPGMSLWHMPVFTWTALCVSAMIVIAFPPLTVVVALSALDRLFFMHFFTNEAGGNVMNFANIFWMWGHPEVYILVLPGFGVFSELASTFSSKRIYGYISLVYATILITIISAIVWLHHFFTMGSSATVNSFFALSTMAIAVPTGIKVFNWLFTMYRGRVRLTSAMHWTIGFIILFVIGGMTGVMLAIPPVDYNLHNTTFLVAHFHNVIIPGVLFGYVAGYQYWFPKAFGFTLDEKWGLRSFWGWFIGFILTFTPMYMMGLMGLPRRTSYVLDPGMLPMLIISAIGACCILFGIVAIGVQLYVSIKNRHALVDTTGDPWQGRTLEWSIPSPAPEFNFARMPVVDDHEPLVAMKRHDAPPQPTAYEDIYMPKSTPVGMYIGVLTFLLGFGAVWWMWWMVVLSAVAIVVLVIARSSNDHDEYVIPASEVEKMMKNAGQPAGSLA